MSDNVAADELRLLIERVERLEEEKSGLAADIRDVYAEAKSRGFDSKTMRACVRLRKMEKNARQEADALLETYRAALGIDFAGTPLGGAALDRAIDAATRQARQDFARATEGVAVTISHAGGPEIPLNEEALYNQAVALVQEHGKASTSWLQRQLRIGYNSASGLIERMERAGVVSHPDHVGKRSVLVTA